jgi:hypothetical protein
MSQFGTWYLVLGTWYFGTWHFGIWPEATRSGICLCDATLGKTDKYTNSIYKPSLFFFLSLFLSLA